MVRAEPFRYPVNIDRLLEATRTPPDAAAAVRRVGADDVGHDRLGIQAHRGSDGLGFSFPVVILSGRKPG